MPGAVSNHSLLPAIDVPIFTAALSAVYCLDAFIYLQLLPALGILVVMYYLCKAVTDNFLSVRACTP